MCLARLSAWISFFVTCRREMETRGGHRDKLQVDTHRRMINLATEQLIVTVRVFVDYWVEYALMDSPN